MNRRYTQEIKADGTLGQIVKHASGLAANEYLSTIGSQRISISRRSNIIRHYGISIPSVYKPGSREYGCAKAGIPY